MRNRRINVLMTSESTWRAPILAARLFYCSEQNAASCSLLPRPAPAGSPNISLSGRSPMPRRCGNLSASLGWSAMIDDRAIEEWLDLAGRHGRGPALIRSGHGARDWMNRQCHTDPLAMDGMFLAPPAPGGIPATAATSPCPSGRRRPSSITALALRVGTEWQAGFLTCIAAASRAAREELAGLQRAQTAGAALARTARSHLPQALDHLLRTPVVTAHGLAESLAISPRAALGLLRQLTEAGVIHEATGRAAWRAFTTT